jgi:hypothetical protein
MDSPAGMWRVPFVVVSVKETMGKKSDNAEPNASSIKALWPEAFGLCEFNLSRWQSREGFFLTSQRLLTILI